MILALYAFQATNYSQGIEDDLVQTEEFSNDATDAWMLNARSIEYYQVLHFQKLLKQENFSNVRLSWRGVVFIEKRSQHQRPLYHLALSQLFSLSGFPQYDCEPFFYSYKRKRTLFK